MERVMEPWEPEPTPGDAEDAAVHALLAVVIGLPVVGAIGLGVLNPEELGFAIPLLVAVLVAWVQRRHGRR